MQPLWFEAPKRAARGNPPVSSGANERDRRIEMTF
jgi:hypothetical protein